MMTPFLYDECHAIKGYWTIHWRLKKKARVLTKSLKEMLKGNCFDFQKFPPFIMDACQKLFFLLSSLESLHTPPPDPGADCLFFPISPKLQSMMKWEESHLLKEDLCTMKWLPPRASWRDAIEHDFLLVPLGVRVASCIASHNTSFDSFLPQDWAAGQ